MVDGLGRARPDSDLPVIVSRQAPGCPLQPRSILMLRELLIAAAGFGVGAVAAIGFIWLWVTTELMDDQ